MQSPPVRAPLQAGVHPVRLLPELRRLLLNPARLARGFKLISCEPLDRLRLSAGQPAEHKAESRQLGIAAKIPVSTIFVRGLMVVVRGVIFRLRAAPVSGMALEQIALIN